MKQGPRPSITQNSVQIGQVEKSPATSVLPSIKQLDNILYSTFSLAVEQIALMNSTQKDKCIFYEDPVQNERMDIHITLMISFICQLKLSIKVQEFSENYVQNLCTQIQQVIDAFTEYGKLAPRAKPFMQALSALLATQLELVKVYTIFHRLAQQSSNAKPRPAWPLCCSYPAVGFDGARSSLARFLPLPSRSLLYMYMYIYLSTLPCCAYAPTHMR